MYNAATTGWIPNGNYTSGWLILDKDNPSIIKQRSTVHLLVPTEDYEIGILPWPEQHKRVVYAASLVPTETPNLFRLWYGAADANVASALVQINIVGQ